MLTLLLAEDDLCIRRVVEIALKRSGFLVTSVGDGEAAIETIATRSFDIVLLDGMMPKRDGLSACRLIRQSPSTAAIPIVILSARSQNTDEVSAIEAGATAFIKKPFDANALGDKLRAIIAAVAAETGA